VSAEYKEIEEKIRSIAAEALMIIQAYNLQTTDFKEVAAYRAFF
jgi:hypothetical protein